MRICYISSQARSVDGWGRYTVELARAARDQHSVVPVLVTAHPQVDESLAGCPHFTLLPELFKGRATTLRSLLLTGQLKGILRGCDAVHVIAEPYMPLAALAAPRGLPLILSAFGTWAIRPLESRASRALFAPAFKRADLILSISDYTRRWMQRLLPDLKRVEVLPGGVHPEAFAVPTDPAAHGLPAWVGREPYIFSAGAVKPRKGQHIALEAAAIARQRFPDLHYVMAGSLDAAPDYVARLRARAAELGMADHVHFLGQVPPYGPLIAWYQQAAAFILPSVSQGSSFEGLGFVYLEAGAAGTPSIGTYDCGAEEAIRHGETGFLVPQGDAQAAAEAIISLLEDPNRRAAMGQAARERSVQLSWANLAARVAEHYRRLIDARR